MYDCTASMVIYNNPSSMIRTAASGFLETECRVHLTVIDNSPTPALAAAFDELPVLYHFYGENVGFGRGHNWAIFNAPSSRYHLILNPDIIIHPGSIAALIDYLDTNPDVGMLCPKVLNEDGTVQHLNKRYPTVLDLFLRRFVPKITHCFIKNRLAKYETHDIGYDSVHDVEFMPGAFMMCRSDILKKVKGFDERYFMYFEDCDLAQKFQLNGARTVYYPTVCVTHLWERGAHRSFRLMWVLIINMVRYFNKWGWKIY